MGFDAGHGTVCEGTWFSGQILYQFVSSGERPRDRVSHLKLQVGPGQRKPRSDSATLEWGRESELCVGSRCENEEIWWQRLVASLD